MALYAVGCPHCMTTTTHNAESNEEAEAKHIGTPKHADMQEALNTLTGKRNEDFTHGKDHN